MGLFSDMRKVLEWSRVDLTTPVSSPLSSSHLTQVAFSDLAGVPLNTITRTEAMAVPAIAKGRALIAGLLARHPLRVYDTLNASALLQDSPWLTATNTPQSPRQRNLWTYDDLIFGGLSCWATQRNNAGDILDSYRVAPMYWNLDPDSLGVIIDGKAASTEEAILIEGPQEGLLDIAAETIQAAIDMTRAWANRVKTPIPLQVLTPTDVTGDLDPDGTEARAMVAAWEARRQEGGTGFLPYGIKLETPGADGSDAELYIQGRNALRLDIANYLNLPAALLEGSMSTASLTYSTGVDKRNDLTDLSLGYWADALEARLSQDDIVPSGRNVAHDLTDLATTTQPTRSPNQED